MSYYEHDWDNHMVGIAIGGIIETAKTINEDFIFARRVLFDPAKDEVWCNIHGSIKEDSKDPDYDVSKDGIIEVMIFEEGYKFDPPIRTYEIENLIRLKMKLKKVCESKPYDENNPKI